eukprot:m.63616 g.63616  ORF g.63616 m.63616 type:complete len:208 (-) comp15851_c0_seq1:355-978(-)
MADGGDGVSREEGFFGESANLKNAVSHINELPESKLPKLLQKIVDKLHLPDVKPFSADEEDALCEAFGIENATLTSALDTISFIFETIAYKQIGPKEVVQHTQKAGLGESQAMIFGKVWAALGPGAIQNLRDRSFYAREATDVSWRLNLLLSQSTQSKVKKPTAQFEVTVASKGEKDAKVQMEFDHSELFKFYTQLEIIQQQLDQLS